MRITGRIKNEIKYNWPSYLLAVALVALATELKYLAEPNIIPTDVPILYFLAIVPAAIFLGLGPSIFVCILSLLAYDYFFIPPLHQITLLTLQEAPIEGVFLVVGVIISLLSSNLREKNRIARTEIATRKKAEAELMKYQSKLEEMVKERTSELEKTNLELVQEIEERHKSEQALSQSERRWATTLASIGDGVIATDIAGKITFVNSEAEALTGWKLDEAQGQPVEAVFQIINEYTRQKASNPVERVLQQGTICNLANHTILVRSDKSEVAIDDSAAPIRTPDGRTSGVVLIFRNISERKKAEKALKESEERFFKAFRASPVAQAIAQMPEGRWVNVNDSFLDLLGYSREEVIGHTSVELGIIDPEERARILQGFRERGELQNQELRVWTKNGKPLTVLSSNQAITINSQPHAISTMLDITDRKAAEAETQTTLERFYTTLSNLPLGLLLVSNEGMVEFANQAFCDMFRLKESPAELRNIGSDDLIARIRHNYRDPEKAVGRLKQIVNKGERVSEEEVLTRDERILLRDFIPIRLGQNKFGRLWIHRDATERRQFVRRLRESEQRFRLALGHAPVSIAAQDRDLRFIWAYNQRTINPRDMINKTDADLFAPADAAHLVELKREVMSKGVEKREALWVTSNGKRVFEELFLEPLKDEEGKIVGVAVAAVDLTEIKIADEALQRNKERFEILSEANSLLLTAAKPEKIIQTIAEKVMVHLGCDVFFNYIADDQARKLKLNAYAGISAATAAGISWLDYGQAICGCAAQDGCRMISENVQENGDMRAALVRSFGVQAYACHPLKIGLVTMGTLSFGTCRRTSFTEDELSLMKTVADQVSVAMERKISEDRLSQAVQKLNAHMANSPLAIIEFDPQFRVVRWSRAAERIFGWSESEILGRAISEIKWVYKEDADLVGKVSADFQSGNKPTYLNVNRNYRKDGKVIECEWYNSSIYDSDGNLTSVLSQVVDITERKKAEEELRETKDYLEKLINYANAPIIVWDPAFRVTRFNHAFERLTGLNAQNVIGGNLDILFPEESKAHSMEHIGSTSSGQRMEVEEIPIRNVDGSVRTVLWNSATLFAPDGKTPIATVAQGQDITGRKKAEEAMQRYALELETHRTHLEEMVRERTVELQSLSYRLIMVQEEERRHISRELHDQTGQSLTVLNLMLAKALRSPETSKADIQEALQTVKEVLAQVRDLSSNLHPGMLEDLGLIPTLNWYFNDFDKKTGINIHFTHSGLEDRLPSDVNITIYRVIQEALTNIARYAGVKKAAVTMHLKNHELNIRIEDNGKGFNVGSQPLGVGLRGMRERVNALNGRLTVTAAPEKGTIIEAELPIQ